MKLLYFIQIEDHYRWKEWINLLKEAKISRSMSKKGCSPDDSACEGFFWQNKK